ncbi:EamA family transporter [Candidatus Woesearchaeota archaeon]|nr:EamA family transporter [Candidatus Woesearchaeota archaeon]
MNLMIAVLITIGLTFIGAFGSLLLKIGSAQFRFNILSILKNIPLIAGLFLYVAGSIIFMFVLKYADLSYLYPFISLSYVWACLLSIKFLNENMNFYKWISILLIIIGVSFVGFGS